jgi:hypothetical protein
VSDSAIARAVSAAEPGAAYPLLAVAGAHAARRRDGSKRSGRAWRGQWGGRTTRLSQAIAGPRPPEQGWLTEQKEH